MILVAKHRDIYIPKVAPVRMAGFYKFGIGKRGIPGYRIETDWQPNIITDIGLNRLGTGSWGNVCVVGTGNTAPAATDTQLATFLASTTTGQAASTGNSGASPYYGYQRVTRRFAEGVAAGNLAEVGMGWATTSLFSRALILDGGGSPTTITVLSDEFLDVTYELRLYVPETDDSGSVTITGVGSIGYTQRAAAATGSAWEPPLSGAGWGSFSGSTPCTAFSGSLGAITSTPSGTFDNCTTSSQSAYSNNSLTYARSAQWGLNDGNVGGIKSITLQNGATSPLGRRQIEFASTIAKDATNIFTFQWETSWARKTI